MLDHMLQQSHSPMPLKPALGSSVGICGDFFVLRVVSLWVAIIKNAIIKNAKGTVFKFDRFQIRQRQCLFRAD